MLAVVAVLPPLHWYKDAPETESVVLCPAHTVVLPEMFNAGGTEGLIVIVCVAVDVPQVLVTVSVTVYVPAAV